jgi:hypothetical protein
MPLIHRIEVSNFMNSGRVEPWRPDWPHQIFELNNENCAISITNGKGKSTLVHTLLAMLTWHGADLKIKRNNFFAPTKTGRYTHFRVEVSVDIADNDLIANSGGAIGGRAMVFGMYGNSGENQRWSLYSYVGTFEDCPIATISKFKRNLVPDKEFHEMLGAISTRYPVTLKDHSQKAWRDRVGSIFDLPGLEQQLRYQRANAAEGSNSYFDVADDRTGKTYSTSLFYERLAPELLAEVMGDKGEDGEHGIEDTIHEKARGLIHARHRTDLTSRDLLKAERVVGELRRISDAVGKVEATRQERDKRRQGLSVDMRALQHVLIDDPIPGVPKRPPPLLPEISSMMVMQGGIWYLPDIAFKVFTGEERSPINQRAERNEIEPILTNRVQVIDFTRDSLFGTRGPAAKLYVRQSALKWVSHVTKFNNGWTIEKAATAVTQAFDWAEANPDSNPARILDGNLAEKLKVLEQERETMNGQHDFLTKEREGMRSDEQMLNDQQAEYRRMLESGLFTAEELATPDETGKRVKESKTASDKAIAEHRAKMRRQDQVFLEWKEFVAEHGEIARPGAMAADLLQKVNDAQRSVNATKSTREAARASKLKIKAENDRLKHQLEAVSGKVVQLDGLKPLVERFQKIFPGETPEGLDVKVLAARDQARNALQTFRQDRAKLEAPLAALKAFRSRFGAVDITDWLAARTAKSDELGQSHLETQEKLDEKKTRLEELHRESIAPGKVAREALQIAGGSPDPVHKAIESLDLDPSRKERALTLFSALLFAPVYRDLEAATNAAKNLALAEVESPVLLHDELTAFCRGGDISFNEVVAHTWLVGFRSRQVACLMDPSLVARERKLIEEEIATLNIKACELVQQRALLVPSHNDSILGQKASDAVTKNVEVEDERLRKNIQTAEEALPGLEKRASPDAIDAIRASQNFRKIVAGDTEEGIRESCKNIRALAEKAANEHGILEAKLLELEDLAETQGNALVQAQTKALVAKLFHRIQCFIDHPEENPIFMLQAEKVDASLVESNRSAIERGEFRFDLAEAFAKYGEVKKKRLEERLSTIKQELQLITTRQPQLMTELHEIAAQRTPLTAQVIHIDAFVRLLIENYRKLAAALQSPDPVNQSLIEKHDLYVFAATLRKKQSATQLIAALADIGDETGLADVSEARAHLEEAQHALKGAQDALNREIDRVISDRSLGLPEHVMIELEQAKLDPTIIARHHRITLANYEKNCAANETAKHHLDEEWDGIADWLRQFTLRLPDNFQTMRSVFSPGRDPSTGRVERAGFDIEGTLANFDNVRATLDEIICDVEKFENVRKDAEGGDEKIRDSLVAQLRKRIRDKFYQRLILNPTIKVCMPSVSVKPLLLESKMLSSGQSVAMTLLWIVKMADYVAERDLRRHTINSAKLKGLRTGKTHFVIIDGAFSHLSDKNLINDALTGIGKTRGKFQLIITGHDQNYQNDFVRFPTFIVGREMGNRMMYAESETRRLMTPEEVGSHTGAMELMGVRRLADDVVKEIE